MVLRTWVLRKKSRSDKRPGFDRLAMFLQRRLDRRSSTHRLSLAEEATMKLQCRDTDDQPANRRPHRSFSATTSGAASDSKKNCSSA